MDDVKPGPKRPEVVFDNRYHVSEDVWDGSERGVLETHCGSRLLRDWQLSDAQVDLLEMFGFGVFKNPNVVLQNDAALITALVERWRPETNTFHMRFGELTITLEDVGFILGLPVMGQPLTGGQLRNPRNYFETNWFERLSTEDLHGSYFRGGISTTWLHSRYHTLPGDDPIRIIVHTKAYMMYICGTVLFPTASRNVVHPKWIRALQIDEEIPKYAWGAGVLAYLYKGLEFASKKNSKTMCGCLVLLQVWSYERLLPGRPSRGPRTEIEFPVAEGWTYCTCVKVLGKRRGTGPHHNLHFYRGELDGVAGEVVEWTPYSRFDHLVDWELIEAKIAGQARVPLICYDVVEFQHPDRVMKQFGYDYHIPPAAVQMSRYRAAKISTFVVEDSRRKWFVEIGLWLRFCDRFIGLIDEWGPVSDEVYRRWYAEVTRIRIGKPQPQPETQYRSRELYDNVEGLKLIEAGMSMCKKLDAAQSGDEIAAQLGALLGEFVLPYNEFMAKFKGAAFVPHQFQHVEVLPRVETGSDFDVIDITQPLTTQESSQVDAAVGPSIRPAKCPFRRMKEDKWDITKVLSAPKREAIIDGWGWGRDKKVKIPTPLCHPKKQYECYEAALKSLRPSEWVEDTIVHAYQILLRNREEELLREMSPRKPNYFFMDPLFMVLARNYLDKEYKGLSKREKQLRIDEKAHFFVVWATQEEGPTIAESDYIFFPCVVNENHWVLFVFSVKEWQVIVLDPLYEDRKSDPLMVKYHLQFTIMEKLVPSMLRYFSPHENYPRGDATVKVAPRRPKQHNGSDCGVLVMKYMDYIVHGYDLQTISWTKEDVENFRFRIARELQMGKPRCLPGFCIRERKKG